MPNTEEPARKAFVDEFVKQFCEQPRFNDFTTFMNALPLDAQYHVASIMMAYGINVTSPEWVTFAVAVRLSQNMESVGEGIVGRIADRGDRLVSSSTALAESARAILTGADDIHGDVARLVDFSKSFASTAASHVRAATQTLVGDLKRSIEVVTAGERAALIDTRTRYGWWISITLATAVAAGVLSFFAGHAWGYADGRARSDAIVRGILRDGSRHKSAAVRAFVINEFQSTDYWK